MKSLDLHFQSGEADVSDVVTTLGLLQRPGLMITRIPCATMLPAGLLSMAQCRFLFLSFALCCVL